MKIQGFQKLTLLDYPGNISATVFTSGCNFCCPFCHNKDLVIKQKEIKYIDEKEIFEYLDNRKNIISAICITGGEPLIQKDIIDFIKDLKKRNLKIKLDTNGSNPKILEYLIDEKLIDYVAMDIKNSKKKYGLTNGINNYDIKNVDQSIKILLKNKIDYEFRTTVVFEFHEKKDFVEIADWIDGCKKYVLQQFEDSGNLILEGLHQHSNEKLIEFKKELDKKLENVEIRGF